MKTTSIINRIRDNIRETYLNKVIAIMLFLAGMLPVMVDNDGTFLLLAGIISIGLFFAKKNVIQL